MKNAMTVVDLRNTPLPTRAEKRIVPFTATFPNASADDATLLGVTKSYYDYIWVRIPGRGATSSASMYYRFLVNPERISVTKQMMDAQALTKGGWQIGVAGEDFTMINIEGRSPGRYFTYGLTDGLAEYSVSYRSLLNLEMLVENNGCFFEGEQINTGGLAPSSQRRRIKMHQDIELAAGEFVWSGMFESLAVTEDAENPFLASYSLSFVAWKERYRANTPYLNPIRNDVQRGHTASRVAINASIDRGSLPASTLNRPLPPNTKLSSDTAIPPSNGPLNDIVNPDSGTFSA